MKPAIPAFFVLFLGLFGCSRHSSSNIVPVTAGLKETFSYKPGSYWVYTDTVSGEQDSAYVSSNTTTYVQLGCVLDPSIPRTEHINIMIAVSDGNIADKEQWFLSLQDSSCSIAFQNSRDSIGSFLSFVLFKYPIGIGNVYGHAGCVPVPDNGSITDIIPEQSVNNQVYTNAARSAHGNDTLATGKVLQYNDCFYVNTQAGLIEMVFNHPQDAVYRNLKLLRYHIVK